MGNPDNAVDYKATDFFFFSRLKQRSWKLNLIETHFTKCKKLR